ncbi:L,D-transpeptidase [Roseovarius sp.]|uniref:L,D-transpeptidase n=1 Tax=Roseovarius sp. TaxID=1486281 RepID=UPI003D097B05
MSKTRLTRRATLLGAAVGLAAPSVLLAQDNAPLSSSVKRNASSFTTRDWNDYFDSLGTGRIVCDINSRAVHHWNASGVYSLYPSSVPMTDELTRRGYTEIVRKKVGPTWTPTESMKERDPSLPDFMDAGPGNPLGTHAMYLAWPAYLIHGTHDTRKIGRRSSSGCIGLYNEHIAELFAKTEVGTKVLVL